MIDILLKLLSGLVDVVLSTINGLIVGAVTFVVNLLDGLDNIDGLLTSITSVIQNFFTSLRNLGSLFFPFLPAEWIAIVETSLVVLVVGLIIKKKVTK